MRPRIVIEEHKRYTSERPPQTDHYVVWYVDATGKWLYYAEHQEQWVSAYAELRTKLQEEGIKTKDLPMHRRTRYLGEP